MHHGTHQEYLISPKIDAGLRGSLDTAQDIQNLVSLVLKYMQRPHKRVELVHEPGVVVDTFPVGTASGELSGQRQIPVQVRVTVYERLHRSLGSMSSWLRSHVH